MGWKQKNRNTLRRAARAARKAAEAIRAFGKEYEKQWLGERKPFGLEIPQTRIAGVAKRLEHLTDRICTFLKSGQPVPELELEFPDGYTPRRMFPRRADCASPETAASSRSPRSAAPR